MVPLLCLIISALTTPRMPSKDTLLKPMEVIEGLLDQAKCANLRGHLSTVSRCVSMCLLNLLNHSGSPLWV